MGALYGTRGLELLQAFDRWFLARAEWILGGAALFVVALLVWALWRRWGAGDLEARW